MSFSRIGIEVCCASLAVHSEEVNEIIYSVNTKIKSYTELFPITRYRFRCKGFSSFSYNNGRTKDHYLSLCVSTKCGVSVIK